MRTISVLAATLVAAAATVLNAGAAAAYETAASCPGGETPCVYLPGGSYTLGNPVTFYDGAAPSSRTVLRHCDSTGTNCDETTVQLNGYSISSSPTTVLTLNIPGEGVGLAGTTPVLYLGAPQAVLGSARTGVTLTVSGTAFVVWDSSFDFLQFACNQLVVPPLTSGPSVSGTFSPCYYSFTVAL